MLSLYQLLRGPGQYASYYIYEMTGRKIAGIVSFFHVKLSPNF